MKPTAGRCDDPGRFSLPIGERAIVSQVGPIGRTVDDVGLALEIINGGRNPAVEPPMPLGDPAAVDVATLRVAYYADDGTFAVSPAVRRAVVEAAGMLAGQGAQVVEWRPPDVGWVIEQFFGIFTADGGKGLREVLAHEKKDPRIARLAAIAGQSRPTLAVLRGLLGLLGQRTTVAMLRSFGHKDTSHYWRLIDDQMRYRQRFAAALDGDEGGPFDVIICPAHSLAAFPHGASNDLVLGGGYVVLYNYLGYPTGIVPVTKVRAGEESTRKRSRDAAEKAARRSEKGSAGLPVGVQVVARPWREHVALAAMRTIEAAASTHDDYPGIALLP
jgi:fatty acid amide hydrolase